ncbi:MAG: HepT-like ribonuclease domain-containing protein [Rhodanobacteraceae bacterium]
MLDAIQPALGYVSGFDKERFLRDRRTQQAVVMNLVVIGEAATKLVERHPDFVPAQPSIPWNSMRGMRNRLAHGYFDIDLDVVWDTLQHDLPALERQLHALVHGEAHKADAGAPARDE